MAWRKEPRLAGDAVRHRRGRPGRASGDARRALMCAARLCEIPSLDSPSIVVFVGVGSGRLAGGLHGVQRLRVLGRDQAEFDEVERADEAVGDPEPAGPRDRVAERDRPVVLEQDQRRGRVVGDLLQDVPRLLVGERVKSVLRGRGTRFGAGDHALLALDPEADQGADLAADLDRLVLGEVREVHDLDLSVGVLVHGERVDDADGVALAELLELADDLAVEVRVTEAQDDELNWSDGHDLSVWLGGCSAVGRLRPPSRAPAPGASPRWGEAPEAGARVAAGGATCRRSATTCRPGTR